MEKEYTLFNLSFLIIVGLILIVLSASISFIVAQRITLGKNNNEIIEKDVTDFTGITYNLGTFTTDLRDTNRTRIIKVEIHLELDDRKGIEEIEERKIQLQDRILTILRSKTAEELKGNEGKQLLSDEIKKGLEEFLTYKIVNVYFNDFIIAQ